MPSRGCDIEYGSNRLFLVCILVVEVLVSAVVAVAVVPAAVRAGDDNDELADADREVVVYCPAAAFVAAHTECMGYAVAHHNVNDNTIVLNKNGILERKEILLIHSTARDAKL